MEIRDELCREHAALIVGFMEFQTNGNWQNCLDMAAQEYDSTGADLWLHVTLCIRTQMRQAAQFPGAPTNRSELDNDIPF